MGLLSRSIELFDTENAFKIGPHIAALEEQGKRVVKCNIGEPDFPVPQFIREEIKRQIDADNAHYCDPQGLLSLRTAVAKHFSESRGIHASPDRVVIFPGVKPTIGLVQQAYCDPDDEVVYPSPGFPIYESFISYVRARPVPMHLKEEDDFSLSGEQLAPLLSRRTKLIILNFPSNPTGAVASLEQLEGMARAIRSTCSENVRVYSDEIYEDSIFDGAAHGSIISCAGMERMTILVGGVSKGFSWTGGRVGWALFPTVEEAMVFKNLNINYFSCVPPYNQEGARLALESPLGLKVRRQMAQTYQERRDVVVDGLNTIDGISCRKPKGAFYVFPNISDVCERLGILKAYEGLPHEVRKQTSPSTLFQMFLLYDHQVATLDRKSFGRIGAENRHYLRLSIATDMDSLKEGLERIRKASSDRKGFEAFFEKGKYLY
ncbi:MAG TPA: aminotransferase class I/II-fold pyridoxal phosphate-dependent enzyme [Syntrophorhabdales bacterium]|nr:aminotransferase class I/II-fold pyridoxal phosphate-dependent enzyme [Syntrophorhabdales bacterium]